MTLPTLAEEITVTASAPPAVETTEVATSFDAQTVNQLPTGRTIDDIVALAPGVTEAGPNDQITISGSMSFESLFLVNGVVVNENVRGQPNPLYIEDAVQETTVLTGGISAEFGRFTGGVVSTLTKSGGNEFSGSLRDSLTNDDWTEKSDFVAQLDPIDETNSVYEATLGGRILRDRLWFFAAGRSEERETGAQTFDTAIPYDTTRDDRRIEGKLTGQITNQHSLVASYIDSDLERQNFVTSGRVVDLRSLSFRDDLRELRSLHYNGIFTDRFLVEGQYSEMEHAFALGANTRDLIEGTLLLDANTGQRAWSPTFCGRPCGSKERNNESWLGKASYFLSTRATGNHSLVGRLRGVPSEAQREQLPVRQRSSHPRQLLLFRTGRLLRRGPGLQRDRVGPGPRAVEDFRLRHALVVPQRQVGAEQPLELQRGSSLRRVVRHRSGRATRPSTTAPSARAWRHATTCAATASTTSAPPTAATSRRSTKDRPTTPPPRAAMPPTTGITRARRSTRAERRATSSSRPTRSSGRSSTGSTPSAAPRTGTRTSSPVPTSPGSPCVSTGRSRRRSWTNTPWATPWRSGAAAIVRADYIDRTWGDFYVVRRNLQTGRATDPNGDQFDQGVIENGDDEPEPRVPRGPAPGPLSAPGTAARSAATTPGRSCAATSRERLRASPPAWTMTPSSTGPSTGISSRTTRSATSVRTCATAPTSGCNTICRRGWETSTSRCWSGITRR